MELCHVTIRSNPLDCYTILTVLGLSHDIIAEGIAVGLIDMGCVTQGAA